MSDCFACFTASSKGEAKETSRKELQQQQQQSGVPSPGSRRKRPASSKAPVVPPKGVPQANRPSPPQTPPQKSSPEPQPEPHPEPPPHALTNGLHAEPEIASLADSWSATPPRPQQNGEIDDERPSLHGLGSISFGERNAGGASRRMMQAAIPETPALRDEGGPAEFDRVDSLPDSEFSFRAHLPPPLEERESPNLRRKENARPASSAAPQPLASRDALSAAQPVPLGERKSQSLPAADGPLTIGAKAGERGRSKSLQELDTNHTAVLSAAPDAEGEYGAEAYDIVGQLGIGRTGVTKLMRNRQTAELVAGKWIEHVAGEALSVNTEREIVNHRRLLHPNIIKFLEVFATDEHLVIVMEYASGGHLSERIATNGPLPEDKARALFQQLVDGMSYCHKQGIVHRNLRMENMLMHGSFFSPTLKISGFGYSKAPDIDSAPRTNVGTPAYTPPEMLSAVRNEGAAYDGRAIDVWSAGIILFYMLTAHLPFDDPAMPNVLTRKMMQKVVSCTYSFPENVRVSAECRDLFSRIFTPSAAARISSAALSAHPWLAGTLLAPPPPRAAVKQSSQTEDDIRAIIARARDRQRRRAKQRPQVHVFNEDLLDTS